jgi:hypothetical protein
VIKTASGGEITLEAAQVKEVKRQTAVERIRTDSLRFRHGRRTVEMEWCRENRLLKQRART